MSGVNNRCPRCHLDNRDIMQTEFQCFPGSPNQVTFRGKVQDRAQATARKVINYMEQWISTSDTVTIPVHHARLDINSTCVVLIASLDDPECPGYLSSAPPVHTITTAIEEYRPRTTVGVTLTHDQTTTAQNQDNGKGSDNSTPSKISTTSQPRQGHADTVVVVGGVVASVFIITVGLVITLLLCFILLYRHLHTSK